MRFSLALVFQAAVQLMPVWGMDQMPTETLQAAAREWHVDDIGGQLIREGANVNPVLRGTPLYEAASAGHLRVVELLLANDADPQIADRPRVLPIVVAAQHGHRDVVRRLVEVEGASRDTLAKALFISAFNGHVDVLDYLLETDAGLMNANYNFGSSSFDKCVLWAFPDEGVTSCSPLMLAVVSRKFDVVLKFIQHGATIDSDLLRGACRIGHVGMVKLFLDKGADMDEDAINNAFDSRRFEVVELLIQRGATKGIRSGLLRTWGSFKMTQVLLDNGADPNVSRSDGITPLLTAVLNSEPETVALLLGRGADLRPDKFGRDPLEQALVTESSSRDALISVFVQQGYVTKQVASGYSALSSHMHVNALRTVMEPITMIKAAASALTPETTPMEAYNTVFPVPDLRGGSMYRKGLIAFAFEARKGGIDLFLDFAFRENFLISWSESRIELVSSIISKLVILGCSDVNFFYTVSSYLENADENMLRHCETVLKTLIASSLSEATRSLLNEMMVESFRCGRLHAVVEALSAIFDEEEPVKRSLRSWGFRRNAQDPSSMFELPPDLVGLVMSHLYISPSDPRFKEKAMGELLEATSRIVRATTWGSWNKFQ